MSSSVRSLHGVAIDVGALFSMQVDFGHLSVTITAILDALAKQQAKTDAAETAAAAATKAVEALQGKVDSLQEKVDAQGHKLSQSESTIAEQAILINDLSKKEMASAARVAHLEAAMQTLNEMHIPRSLKEHGTAIAAIDPRLKALENAEKDMRALLQKSASRMDLLEALANGADAAARAAASAVGTAAPAPVATSTPSPLAHLNPDAIMAAIKKLQQGAEVLATRVALLENRPVQKEAASSKRGSANANNNDSAALALLNAAEDQTSRQLAATISELRGLAEKVAGMQKVLDGKADKKDLESKADKKDLSALAERVARAENQIKSLEIEVAKLKDQIAALQGVNAQLLAKLNALLDASTCGECHNARPTVRCGKCAKSFCDACDDMVHGEGASAEMRAHLRAPLQPFSSSPPPPPSSSRHSLPGGTSSDPDETRRWAEEMFDLLARKEKATRGDIHELFTKDKELRAQLAALLKAGGDGQRNYEEISAALKKLEAELRALIAQTAQQGRNYTDHRIEELLLKLRELERALERGMKSELKRFERDVLVFMESAHGGAGGDGNSDAAVGKIHFRCLSCDQHVGNLQGPSSLLYARAVGGSAPINPNATNMQIDKGKELYLNGRDGSVYKGREPTQVTIAPGDLSRPSQFNVHYSDRMVTTNPRHHTILDQKTVSYNHNHAHTTPQRLPLTRPHTAGEIAPPGRLGQLAQPDSLPPTRPSTRGGGRAAISASRSQVREEEKTPLREQLQVPG